MVKEAKTMHNVFRYKTGVPNTEACQCVYINLGNLIVMLYVYSLPCCLTIVHLAKYLTVKY